MFSNTAPFVLICKGVTGLSRLASGRVIYRPASSLKELIQLLDNYLFRSYAEPGCFSEGLVMSVSSEEVPGAPRATEYHTAVGEDSHSGGVHRLALCTLVHSAN